MPAPRRTSPDDPRVHATVADLPAAHLAHLGDAMRRVAERLGWQPVAHQSGGDLAFSLLAHHPDRDSWAWLTGHGFTHPTSLAARRMPWADLDAAARRDRVREAFEHRDHAEYAATEVDLVLAAAAADHRLLGLSLVHDRHQRLTPAERATVATLDALSDRPMLPRLARMQHPGDGLSEDDWAWLVLTYEVGCSKAEMGDLFGMSHRAAREHWQRVTERYNRTA